MLKARLGEGSDDVLGKSVDRVLGAVELEEVLSPEDGRQGLEWKSRAYQVAYPRWMEA